MESKVLKTRAAAAYLAVSPWKLRRLTHEGKVAYISDGDATSAFRFLVADLDGYLNKCRVSASSE